MQYSFEYIFRIPWFSVLTLIIVHFKLEHVLCSYTCNTIVLTDTIAMCLSTRVLGYRLPPHTPTCEGEGEGEGEQNW